MRRELVLVLVALGGCGAVSVEQPLTAADGGAGSSAAGAAAGAAGMAAAGAAGASSSGAAGSAGSPVDAGLEAAAGGPPTFERCTVASFATVCWANFSTDVGCLQGCTDSSDAGVVGTGCMVAASPHHATCVQFCGECPPQN